MYLRPNRDIFFPLRTNYQRNKSCKALKGMSVKCYKSNPVAKLNTAHENSKHTFQEHQLAQGYT